MGNAAHSHSDCGCDPVVSREIIRENPAFDVVVNADYQADPDDAVIKVLAGQIVNGAVVVPTITLASADDAEGPITIVAQGGDVRVAGLNDQNAVNIDGVPSNGTRLVAGGSAITFWPTASDDPASGHGCDCSPTNYWIAECCGELTAGAPVV